MKRKINGIVLAIGLLSLVINGCKESEKQFAEPYGEGKPTLGITIDRSEPPSPAFGLPGVTVSIKASGLLPYEEKVIVRFNGQDAQVTDITETELKVIVPDFASTGVISVSVDDVIVFGPEFSVEGLVNIDPSFRVTQGTNGAVGQVLNTSDGKLIFVGGFTNYDNKGIIRPINRIARAFPDGTYDASLRSGSGANGFLGAIIELNGKFFVGGSFSGYAQRTENISNLTMLNANGSIDTMGISPFRRPDQSDTIKYYPRFNGGFDGSVGRIYEQNGKLLVTGSFRYYVSRQYDKANRLETRDTVILDSTEVRQLARLNTDGTLDKTYRFNTATNMSLPGGNGSIGTYLHTEGALAGKMLVFGSFTRFDEQAAGYILRLNADGSIDPTFNPGGAGADYNIGWASYNPVTRKYMINGNFRSYNGQPISWIAMLNEDGTMDNSFVPKTFGDGGPNFVKQLNDGLIVVGGYFTTYDGIARNGFMILEANGELAVGYNATGSFNGGIYDAIETESADGKRALLLLGDFYRFNNKPVNNLIRVTLE